MVRVDVLSVTLNISKRYCHSVYKKQQFVTHFWDFRVAIIGKNVWERWAKTVVLSKLQLNFRLARIYCFLLIQLSCDSNYKTIHWHQPLAMFNVFLTTFFLTPLLEINYPFTLRDYQFHAFSLSWSTSLKMLKIMCWVQIAITVLLF